MIGKHLLHNNTDVFACEIAPIGSHLYYSILFCKKNTREKILALRGIENKFQNIRSKSNEPQIVQMQFDFWENELTCSHPQHPITQYLQSQNLIDERLMAILKAYKSDAYIQLYEHQVDIINYYKNTRESLEKIIIEDEFLQNFGSFIGRAEFLIYLREYIQKGKIYFSGEQLLKHHVTLYDLSRHQKSASVEGLLQDELNQLKTYWESLDIDLKKLKKLRPSYILAKMYYKQLQEIEKNIFVIFTHKIDLTPIRKLWIALQYA